MKDHQLIEPRPFASLHMRHTSSLYMIYLENLKIHSQKEAQLRTRDMILADFPTHIDEQLACLEFFYMNDFFEDLAVVLHSPYIHQEVLPLYNLLLQRVNTPVSKEQLTELQQYQCSHPSLHCLHLFLMIYAYYDLKVFTALDKYLDDCDRALASVDEPLMYYYLNQRYQELLFHHYWKTDNPILARRHAYKMINTELSPRRKSRMYFILALCQLFNGYDSAMDPLTEALAIADQYELSSFAEMIRLHTIPFISAFHNRTESVHTTDPVEQAHLDLADGRLERAREVLESLSSLTPFQESYLGYVNRDMDMLYRAYTRFITERGDHFFARVPLEYMKRLKTH
ncbi:hypothetical protein GLW04_17720 [Halobacillus litoralis]|uniref:Uncharacterized protein n=1 Tax=Halobacillus litoralis TaxID=45668 RepID=A0A845DVQ2_9BACI|nr:MULTISPECIES: AimR family lysis-lysogeny pheromone receptor [Halobacillus]MYL21741.1 hypothetical protein [Halobacillus litoralis]MYL31689.1 hypothetical protein [Halobacillus halophilus]MYL39891.1 hypothetical protein [Halobacillus litoralis]